MVYSFWIFKLKGEKSRLPLCAIFEEAHKKIPFKPINTEELKKKRTRDQKVARGFLQPALIRDMYKNQACRIVFRSDKVTIYFDRETNMLDDTKERQRVYLWIMDYEGDRYLIASHSKASYVDMALKNLGLEEEDYEQIRFSIKFIQYVNKYKGNPPELTKYGIESTGYFEGKHNTYVRARWPSASDKQVLENARLDDSTFLKIPLHETRDYMWAWFYQSGKITVQKGISGKPTRELMLTDIENVLKVVLLVKKAEQEYNSAQSNGEDKTKEDEKGGLQVFM